MQKANKIPEPAKEVVGILGGEYADQNLRDHRAFINAIREGRIPVGSED